MGQADETGRGVGLHDGGAGLDLGVGLDVLDFVGVEDVVDHDVVGIEDHGAPRVHLQGLDLGGKEVAHEPALADVALLDGIGEGVDVGVDGVVVKGVVVHDNVPVGDDVEGIGVVDGQAHERLARSDRSGTAAAAANGTTCEVEGNSRSERSDEEGNEDFGERSHGGRWLVLIQLPGPCAGRSVMKDDEVKQFPPRVSE